MVPAASRLSKREVARGMAAERIPVPVICATLNVPPRTYFNWRAQGNWPTRAIPALPESVKAEAMRLVDANTPLAEVCRQAGVSRKTLSRWRRLRPIQRWRCDCTAFGVLVDAVTCPKCGTIAPWGKEKSS